MYDTNTVSVIIPVYNKERFLEDTIKSVLSQTYHNWEIILVDDCSTDSSPEIISKYTSLHKNIIYHKQEKNSGAAVARNTALALASGRFVAFLDADDMWLPHKLEKQLAFMKDKDAAMSCTALECVDENGKSLNSIRKVKELITYNFLLHNTIIATSTVIVDRSKSGDFVMPLRRGGQDYATWLMLMRDNIVCYGLNEVLAEYRVLGDSLSSNKFKSVKQVWEIQTKNEGINKMSAIVNVCFFAFNAFKKHFLK